MNTNYYELPKLGYKYDALEPAYSAELLELHYSKHHRAYVDGANKTRFDLAEACEKGDFKHINELQKNLAFHVSGHVLHSLFWRNLEPGNDVRPDRSLTSNIRQTFGGLDALKDLFCAAGAAIQGSGWAALSWDPVSESLLVEQIHDHQGNVINGTVPLLLMDMWEHAYYLQYRNDKKKWITAFWDLINWRDVSARLHKAMKLDSGLLTAQAG